MSDLSYIYDEFKEIEPNDYLQKLKFYEELNEQIFSLQKDQQYFLKFEYVKALFDLGRYQKVLLEIDELIEYIFLHNLSFSDEDCFVHSIFIKAASTFHLSMYDKAIELSKQLVSMKPENRIYAELLRKCYYQKNEWSSIDLRLVAIMSILIIAIAGAAYYLLNNADTGKYLLMLLWINIVILITIGILRLFFELLSRYQAQKTIRILVGNKLKNKR